MADATGSSDSSSGERDMLGRPNSEAEEGEFPASSLHKEETPTMCQSAKQRAQPHNTLPLKQTPLYYIRGENGTATQPTRIPLQLDTERAQWDLTSGDHYTKALLQPTPEGYRLM
ncbi:Hypothetical predicted protein [Pelobates cultripes]|uniref:Uncharacterized protein n=1 Tax=Pelobates cultripes TaxID=61616 RepID=A0AAD1VTI4_PELCU|nr:Hypothetical predicted protein [Pelobates cultripes]